VFSYDKFPLLIARVCTHNKFSMTNVCFSFVRNDSYYRWPTGSDELYTQGSYISGRVKFKDFLRTFKAMYQQRTEYWRKGLKISKMGRWISNSFVRYEHAKSVQQIKMSVLNVKQFQKISINWSKKNLKIFKYFFTNSRIFMSLKFCFQIQGHSRTC
jgi:hypothetical protein